MSAALETRLNARVLASLANRQALIGGRSVPVIFDRTPADPFDGASAASGWRITFDGAGITLAEGDAVEIDAITYTVARTPDVDQSGWTEAALYPQAA